MPVAAPRAVLVWRASELDELVARHGTRGQAAFFLETRGQSLDELEERHRVTAAAREAVLGAVPLEWRRAEVARDQLDRFLFEPGDLVLALGQDGLVANVAKYLTGQAVIGLNPLPDLFEGALVRHPPEAAADLIADAAAQRLALEHRSMVQAELDDGQGLLALNEVFLGHRSHQSARYRLVASQGEERQSSSGLVVTTGTGATGWGRSIHAERGSSLALPAPTDPALAWFAREPWPSVSTGTRLTEGLVCDGAAVELISEMNDGGTLFGDGMEADHLELSWGSRAHVALARQTLSLVA